MNDFLPSRFLPKNFDRRPIGLIAGQGRYPMLVAESIQKVGLPLRLISIVGETEQALIDKVPADKQMQFKLGQLGKMLKSLKKLECGYMIMAGRVTPGRLFKGLYPDIKLLALLNSLKIKNAETMFGAVANEIEQIGVSMLDARSFMDEHIATEGMMTSGKLKVKERDIQHGIDIARGVANLDIGQGGVVRHGTVLAVEAYEGTDEMLTRAGTFKTEDLIFVKTVKRNQDYRIDVPIFGEHTLEVMHQSGITTAALETDSVIMLDKPELLKKAHSLKIALFGYSVS